MASVQVLKAREEEVAREWEWLQTALNEMARALADQENPRAFRLLQQQAMAVGQRRLELGMQLAQLEGPKVMPVRCASCD